MKGSVSKDTAVSRQQGGETQKIIGIKRVDKGQITIAKRSQTWCFNMDIVFDVHVVNPFIPGGVPC